LSWVVSNAKTLSIDPEPGNVEGTSVKVSPKETTTYTLTASNGADTKTATTTVTVVLGAPVVSTFKAEPSTINAGETTALSWSVKDAATISLDHGIGTLTGSNIAVAPTTTTTYTLTATNPLGSVTSTTAITVKGTVYSIPTDRTTTWQPGVTYNGGIPRRTINCATLSPRGNGQDDTANIQAALDACPAEQVVQLSAGTFTIAANTNGAIQFSKSNITLRGTVDANGEPATILSCPKDKSSGAIIALGTLWAKPGESYDLAADVAKDAKTLKVSRNPGFKVGELVIVDELTDDSLTWWAPRCTPSCGGAASCDYPGCRAWFTRKDRPIGQVNEIIAIDTTTNELTFSAPFHSAFRISKSAQLTRIPQKDGFIPTTRSGVEDLKVSGGAGGDGGGNIHFFAATYSWLRNIEADRSAGTSINFDSSFRCELRDSYIHSTLNPNPGGEGYGIGFNMYAADNLVENSISWNFNKVMVMRGSGGGNVLGYNYMDDGWGQGFACIVETGLNASHYATSHMELFEGNQSFNFASDSTWGNSIYILVFRNFLNGIRGAYPPLDKFYDGTRLYYEDLNGRSAITVGPYHWWSTFVGNILGYEGQKPISNPKTQGQGVQTSFAYESKGSEDDPVPMWRIAVKDDGTKESKTVETLIRHGNFDFATKSQAAWTADGVHALPVSLYQTAKPSFINDWPWLNPVTGEQKVLPAKARFNRIHGVK
jgi:hypothetical protein